MRKRLIPFFCEFIIFSRINIDSSFHEIKTSDVGNGEAAADNGFANFADSDGIRKWTAEPVISRKNTKRIG